MCSIIHRLLLLCYITCKANIMVKYYTLSTYAKTSKLRFCNFPDCVTIQVNLCCLIVVAIYLHGSQSHKGYLI